jgi:tetratricopeptide (TPR) repeat protein
MSEVDFNAVMGQAVAFHKAGRLGDAAQLYRRVAAAHPDQPDPLHLLGLALSKLGESAAALREVERAVTLMPQHPGYRFSQGNLLLGMKRFADAEAAFRAALTSQPGDPELTNHLAVALQEQERHDEAIDLLRDIVSRHPAFLPARNNLAAALVRLRQSTEAVEHARAVLVADPGNAEAANNLGSALVELERWDEAERVLRDAVKRHPEHAQLNYNLGLAYKGQRKWVQAEPVLQKAVSLNPTHAPNLVALSVVVRELNLLEDSLSIAERAIKLAPDDPETLLTYCMALRENGLHGEAVAAIEKALEQSRTAKMLVALGTLHWEMGKLDEAKRVLEQALELAPGWLTVYAVLANCERFKSADDPTIVAMREAWQKGGLDEETHMQLGFALGKVHDDIGDHDAAWGYYHQGNQLKRGMVPPFDRSYSLKLPDEVRQTFTRDMLQRQQAAGLDSEEMVFIVGMPRSGTSLCEQIIASHPDAYGAGELIKLREITARAEAMVMGRGGPDYPRCLADLRAEEIRGLAEIYLGHVREAAGERKLRLVDKMPVNFRNIGLMAIMYPKARVVYCKRDAMDNCLSIYFQNFGKGNSFAYDLTDLGHFYVDHVALMDAWREVNPLPILQFDYEAVVADPETQARRLIDFIGLPWDEACLKFHEADRAVRTASAWQVRQPIYKRSVARWRRYQSHLGPLAAALGYNMDEAP